MTNRVLTSPSMQLQVERALYEHIKEVDPQNNVSWILRKGITLVAKRLLSFAAQNKTLVFEPTPGQMEKGIKPEHLATFYPCFQTAVVKETNKVIADAQASLKIFE